MYSLRRWWYAMLSQMVQNLPPLISMCITNYKCKAVFQNILKFTAEYPNLDDEFEHVKYIMQTFNYFN